MITQEKFEVYKIIKRIDIKKTSNYLLLHCSLERIAKEAERMKMEMPVKNVRSSYDYHLSLLLIYCFLSLTEFRVN